MNEPRTVLLVLSVAVGVALVVGASTSSAAFGAYNYGWSGGSDLRALAGDAGTTTALVRNTTGYARADSDAVALVLALDSSYGPRDARRVREFVRGGGTLVVADDAAVHRANDLLAAVGATARLDGATLRDERYNARGPAFPVARNVTDHALTGGVNRLVFNYGTAVEPGNATVLARTSGYAYLDRNGNAWPDENERLGARPVATVESVGDGRVVVVGDPSAFINAMLDRDGNRALARNLVDDRHVLLDRSHAGDIPALALVGMALRRSPAALVAVGLVAVAAIAGWERRTTPRRRGGWDG